MSVRFKLTAKMAFAQAFGYLLANGYWAYILWSETGNPLFPFFNSYFDHEGIMPTLEAKHERFLNANWFEMVAFPFRMNLPERGVYVEIAAPDVRYIALFIAIGCAIIIWWRRTPTFKLGDRTDNRVRIALTFAFLVGWIMWISISSNGRYIFPMSMLCGVLLVSWGGWFSRYSLRGVMYMAGMLVLIQAAHFYHMPKPRWASESWAGKWHGVKVPDVMKEQPTLYRGTEVMSISWVIEAIHPKSSIMQISGSQGLGLAGPGSQNVRAMLNRWSGSSKLIAQIPIKYRIEGLNEDFVKAIGYRVHHLGLNTIDRRHCSIMVQEESFNWIAMPYLSSTVHARLSASLADRALNSDDTDVDRSVEFAVCELFQDEEAMKQHEIQQRQVDQIFDAVENWCPHHFKPRKQRSQRRDGETWVRVYSGTDVVLTLKNDLVRFRDDYRLGEHTHLGTKQSWLSDGIPRPPCRERGGKSLPD